MPDEHPEQRLQPKPTVAAMRGLLDELGGWTVEVLEGKAATRDGILAALDRMIAVTGPDDTCLIHYFGHGGAVRLANVEGPLGVGAVHYISAARPSARWVLEGVLAVELSLALARLDRICGNVSVILDCCKSSLMVRGDYLPMLSAPPWLPKLPVGAANDELLDVESHPRIVRLAATTALHIAYGRRIDEGDLGLLTSCFCEVVREAQGRLDRLTWDAVAHRVREMAIRHRNGGEQWISLAGPRDRLVFSRQNVELPRCVAFVPGQTAGVGWLRAGALQGVEVGDEWAVTELTLDDDLRPRIRARVRVDAVELTRARVVTASPDCRLESLPVGASAYPLTARDPGDVFRRIAAGEVVPSRPDDGLELRWGWFDSPGRRLTASDVPVRLRPGARLWFELVNSSNSDWFVSAIELGAYPRPRLLNTGEPDGMALQPRTHRVLGERSYRHEQGLPLVWPANLPRDQAVLVTVLFLACRRPFELGHRVDHAESEWSRVLADGRTQGSTTRTVGRRPLIDGPEPVHEWTWKAIRYWLEPE